MLGVAETMYFWPGIVARIAGTKVSGGSVTFADAFARSSEAKQSLPVTTDRGSGWFHAAA